MEAGKERRGGLSEYLRAIIREAQALAAATPDTQGGEGAGKPIAAVCPGAMGEAEAYAVLGTDPTADGEEITRLCSRLLEVWTGTAGAAEARRQELHAVAAVFRQKIGGGLG